MRGASGFDKLASHRCFVGEIVSRKNARHAKRIGAERVALQLPPGQRTYGYGEAVVTVTSSGGFTLNKVFHTVPSRLIGHRLRVRLHDSRLEAHDRGCEAELATALAADLSAGQLPSIAGLRKRFAPGPARLPGAVAHLTPLAACEALLGNATLDGKAAWPEPSAPPGSR